MELKSIVSSLLIGLFCLKGVDCTCSTIWPDVQSSQVATMCKDTVVESMDDLYIDTDLGGTTTLAKGTPCTCHVHTQRGKEVTVWSRFDGVFNSKCGTAVEFSGGAIGFHTFLSTPCYSYMFDVETHTYTNITVGLRKDSTPYTSSYCVKLTLKYCNDSEFQCVDGACIPASLRCDNSPDCDDESDERFCWGVTCPEGQILCDDNSTCINADQRCDGVYNCTDQSDEAPKYCDPNYVESGDSSSTGDLPPPLIRVTCTESGFLPTTTTTTSTTTTTPTTTTTTAPPTTTTTSTTTTTPTTTTTTTPTTSTTTTSASTSTTTSSTTPTPDTSTTTTTSTTPLTMTTTTTPSTSTTTTTTSSTTSTTEPTTTTITSTSSSFAPNTTSTTSTSSSSSSTTSTTTSTSTTPSTSSTITPTSSTTPSISATTTTTPYISQTNTSTTSTTPSTSTTTTTPSTSPTNTTTTSTTPSTSTTTITTPTTSTTSTSSSTTATPATSTTPSTPTPTTTTPTSSTMSASTTTSTTSSTPVLSTTTTTTNQPTSSSTTQTQPTSSSTETSTKESTTTTEKSTTQTTTSTTQPTTTPGCDVGSQFECGNGACIPLAWRCDSLEDCDDKSDEAGCSSYVCGPDKFLCDERRTCINSNERCDGTSQCPDLSDESPKYCGTTGPTAAPSSEDDDSRTTAIIIGCIAGALFLIATLACIIYWTRSANWNRRADRYVMRQDSEKTLTPDIAYSIPTLHAGLPPDEKPSPTHVWYPSTDRNGELPDVYDTEVIDGNSADKGDKRFILIQ